MAERELLRRARGARRRMLERPPPQDVDLRPWNFKPYFPEFAEPPEPNEGLYEVNPDFPITDLPWEFGADATIKMYEPWELR